jgi:hypothetical protein
VLRHVRRLLAERSDRGRRASLVLAAIAAVGVVVALYLLFPRQEGGSVTLGLETADPDVAYPHPLAVWPGQRVRVQADGLTPGGVARVELAGRRLSSFTTDPAGGLDGVVELPAELASGGTDLVVVDAGTGRRLRGGLRVEDVTRPRVVVQPSHADPGDTVAVTAGGLVPGVDARVVLDPDAANRTVLRTGRTTRAGLLLLLVVLPADASNGERTVGIESDEGRRLAEPAPLQIRT